MSLGLVPCLAAFALAGAGPVVARAPAGAAAVGTSAPSSPIRQEPESTVWTQIQGDGAVGSYRPTLTLRGTPAAGHTVVAEVAGGPPWADAVLHVERRGTAAAAGSSLERRVSLALDERGRASRTLSWPGRSAGDEVFLRAVVAGSGSTSTWLSHTLSPTEAAAFGAAADGTQGWLGVKLLGVDDALAVASAADEEVAVQLLALDGALPAIHVTATDAGSFGIGYPPEVVGTGGPEFEDYLDELRSVVAPGQTAVHLRWWEPSVGTFTSFMLVDDTGVRYGTFASNMPAQWPALLVSATATDASNAAGTKRKAPNTAAFSVTNVFGVGATGSATVSAHGCGTGGSPSSCHVEPKKDAFPLWQAAVSAYCTIDGGCCNCTALFGWASGFKGVASVGGGTLQISGWLGFSGTLSAPIQECCP